MKEKVFYLLSVFLVTVTTYLILGIWGVVLPFKKNIFQIKINKSIEIVIVHNPERKIFIKIT